jgi:hypothetical protein
MSAAAGSTSPYQLRGGRMPVPLANLAQYNPSITNRRIWRQARRHCNSSTSPLPGITR